MEQLIGESARSTAFRDGVYAFMQTHVPAAPDTAYLAFALLWIGGAALLIHAVVHRLVLGLLARSAARARRSGRLPIGPQPPGWLKTLADAGEFRNLAFVLQGVVVWLQANVWLPEGHWLHEGVELAALLWILFFGLMAAFSALDAMREVTRRSPVADSIPIHGITQAAKLVLSVVFALLVISALMDRSPLLLLSGLGAASAVLMLVFRDPILGLVAGIQLSSNRMLSVGDWLEMPRFGADGEVTDIGLTTVKVRNWDKTITTIPTYALISDSFRNWRGMAESGVRRIKRSVLIDTKSIRFLSDEDRARLSRSALLAPYLERMGEAIETYNRDTGCDLSTALDGRRMTNVGTFRAYLIEYLQHHPDISSDATLMVRQLAPTAQGLPLEIYAFAATTVWAEYEAIQSDIFDHVFAVLPEFGLRAHESPTGWDLAGLRGAEAAVAAGAAAAALEAAE